jgi:GGDEF domain-containing protein
VAKREARDTESAPSLDTACERDRAAEDRDDVAAERDRAADLRGDEAAAGDRTEARQDSLASRAQAIRSTKRHRRRDAENRAEAAGDRRQAAADRLRARRDRESAALERDQAAADRAAAAPDELTGARRRGSGLVEIQREIDRANRTGGRLVAAFVDVDGLKAVNDAQGHSAGDNLLVAVAHVLKARLRSYDLVLRFGGDEFVCVLPGLGLESARRRFAHVAASLTAVYP